MNATATIEEKEKKTVNPINNQDPFQPIHYKLRNPATQEAIVAMVINLIEKNGSADSRSAFLSMLQKAERMYNMVVDRTVANKKLANFANPLIKIAVDTLTVRIKNVIFSMNEGPAQLIAGNEKDEEEVKMTALGQRALAHAIQTQPDKELRHESLLKTAFKFGDGWSKQSWEVKYYTTVVEESFTDPITGEISVDEHEDLVLKELGPQMRWVDPKLIHFPEDCPNPYEAPWFIEEMYVRTEEIKRRIKLGEYQSLVIPEDTEAERPVTLGDDPEKDDVASIVRTGTEKVKGYKKAYAAYVQYKSPYDAWEHPWQFIVNVTDKQLLRATRNRMGQIPYARQTPFPIENRPRGESLPIKLEKVWLYINTVFNYAADTATSAVRPTGFYSPTELLNRRTIEVLPGELHPLRNPKDGVNLVSSGDVKQGILTILQLLLKFYTDMTGITDQVLGQFTEGVERPTVRGTNAIMSQVSIRFEDINKNIQCGLARAYSQMFWMMVHIGGDEYFKRILDEDGVATYFKKQGIDSGLPGIHWDVKILGNTIEADKNLKQRRVLEIFQLFVPLLEQRPDKISELMNFVIRGLELRELENFTESLRDELVNAKALAGPIIGPDKRDIMKSTPDMGKV